MHVTNKLQYIQMKTILKRPKDFAKDILAKLDMNKSSTPCGVLLFVLLQYYIVPTITIRYCFFIIFMIMES